jgi:predicted unusual protein kinase regulating ubiquinone biosynthesis (AarF/ABC1/UbiB family)
MADEKNPPTGRLARLGKLASLSAKVSTGLAARAAARMTGRDPHALERQATETLVATLGELKGAAMKLGQALSMDPDGLPQELRTVLARLQNQAPPVAFSEIEAVVKAELGKAPSEVYREFDPIPIAAASLGQVHHAVTREGVEVAVKVQYPGMVTALQSDFKNLGMLTSAMGRTSKSLDVREYFEEIKNELALETDYRREAMHCRRYRQLVSSFRDLVVPEILDAYSTPRVLTLQLIKGITLQQFAASEADGPSRFRVSSQLIRAIYGPFLLAGEVHADPHPGNFLVTDDGKLAILDFGSIKAFSPTFVGANRTLFRASMEKAPVDVLGLLRQAGFRIELEDPLARKLLSEVLEIAGRPVREEQYDYAADSTSRDMRAVAMRYSKEILHIRPPAEALMFGRAIGGCSQNLRALRAPGNFRAIYRELLPLIPAGIPPA